LINTNQTAPVSKSRFWADNRGKVAFAAGIPDTGKCYWKLIHAKENLIGNWETHMYRTFHQLLVGQLLAVSFLLCGSNIDVAQEPAAQGQPPAASPDTPQKPAGADQTLLDKLERYLTGSRWTGNFTIVGQENAKLNPETYEITKAKHAGGDSWLLTARIKYGDKDNTIELPPLEIKWVDDSPVIVVDKMSIPLMGVFDARVIIRNNKYAGTWTHNDVGGHLFGVIERLKQNSDDDETSEDAGKADVGK
jgi:hypothetical protein